jgi:flagellar FliL protein
MAEEAAQKQATEEEGGGKKKIPLWLIILIASQVVLIAVAVVVLKMMSGHKEAEEAALKEPSAAEQRVSPEKLKDPKTLAGPSYKIDPFIVNLIDDGRGPRFLKIEIQLELETPPDLKAGTEPPVKAELDSRKTQIRDILLMLLTSKRQSDIESPDGKRILRDEIFTRINKVLVTGAVRQVFFTEFVIQ